MIERYLPRASSYAADIDHLFDWILYLVGFWFLLTLAFFLFVLFRFRRKEGVKAQYITGETHAQKRAIEIPHYLILVCDVFILGFTFLVWHKVKIDVPPHDEEVLIVSQQWAWSFIHAGQDGLLNTEDDIPMVNELYLEVDKQYTYHLKSNDVMHSFSVPVFRLKQDSVPGRIIKGHFKPILEGEWDIQCAEMCGYGHGYMPARVFIQSPEEHAAWIAANTPEHLRKDVGAYAARDAISRQAKEDDKNG